MLPKSNTVTIACRLPDGVVMPRADLPAMPYLIYGTRRPNGQIPAVEVTDDGYALTRNVPRRVAQAWFEKNRDAPIVRQGLVAYFIE
jgi:hypothetical protein